MTEAAEARPRVFFALWPTPAEAVAMHRYARALPLAGGRPSAVEALHLTLAFIGEVEAARLGELCALGRELTPPRCALHFDRIGWWHRNQLLWAGCGDPPPELGELAEAVNAMLKRAGLRCEKRPFRAHVTLARKVRNFGSSLPPDLHWTAPRLALVGSELRPGGARYRVLEHFPPETRRGDERI